LKGKILQGFLKIRLIIVYMILIIISIILFNNRWDIVIGLTCGTLVSVMKYIEISRFISKILKRERKRLYSKVFAKIMSLQIITALLMAVAIKFDLQFFWGFVSGVLLIPVIITINGITEALGISHNNFQ